MSVTFTPRGSHDQRLLDTVHPRDWTNPVPADRYDLLVIGAGTGGLVSAAIGAALGARVALVERALMGGDCLNFGCVPSKAVLRAARSWAAARRSAGDFNGPEVSGKGDFTSVMERMRRIRADIAEVDGAERFRSLGVDVFLGEARFTGDDRVSVGDDTLRFRRAILASGARAAVPPIPGLEDIRMYTNESIFSLTELPDTLAILGAGPIGCELAQAFARFGSRVTLLDMEDRPLPREEPAASEAARTALEAAGVRFLGGARVTRARPGATDAPDRLTYDRDGTEGVVECDATLVAAGRRPNVEMDLEAAGITHTRQGVTVDSRLRTTNRRVYAVGDVASPLQFTHVADAQARLAVRNALFFGRGKTDDLVVPMAVYTSPEVARVGPTTRELQEAGRSVETISLPFHDLDRARLDGAEEGFLQVHLEAGSDRILGATMVAEHAGDLLAPLTQAMSRGVGLEKLGDIIHPYPTTVSVVGRAADAYRRRKLTPRVKRFFDIFLRVTRHLP